MCNYVSISINYNVNFHIQKRSHSIIVKQKISNPFEKFGYYIIAKKKKRKIRIFL